MNGKIEQLGGEIMSTKLEQQQEEFLENHGRLEITGSVIDYGKNLLVNNWGKLRTLGRIFAQEIDYSRSRFRKMDVDEVGKIQSINEADRTNYGKQIRTGN